MFVGFCSAVSEEKSKISRLSEAGAVCFPIGQPPPPQKKKKKKKNLVKNVEILLSDNFSWIQFMQWFQRRSRKCLSQSEAGAVISLFRSVRKTQTCRGYLNMYILPSVKFRWILYSGLRRRKCEKLTTDDGQRMITIAHLSLWLRFTNKIIDSYICIVIDVNHKLYIANFELTKSTPPLLTGFPHLLEVQVLDTNPNAIRQFWAEMRINFNHC